MPDSIPSSVRRVVLAEVQRLVGRDFDALRDALKRIESQNSALIVMLNNHDKNHTKFLGALRVLLVRLGELLEHPDKRPEAIKTIQEFLDAIDYNPQS